MELSSQNLQFPAWVKGQLATWQARIDLRHNKMEEASRWATRKGLDPEIGITPLDEINFFQLSDYVPVLCMTKVD